ncbi:hypothetical protein CYMTET_30184, partial [Cymbomonas tetramitiformis]
SPASTSDECNRLGSSTTVGTALSMAATPKSTTKRNQISPELWAPVRASVTTVLDLSRDFSHLLMCNTPLAKFVKRQPGIFGRIESGHRFPRYVELFDTFAVPKSFVVSFQRGFMVTLATLLLVAMGSVWVSIYIFWQESVQRYKDLAQDQNVLWNEVVVDVVGYHENISVVLLAVYQDTSLSVLNSSLSYASLFLNSSNISDAVLKEALMSLGTPDAAKGLEELTNSYLSANCSAYAQQTAAETCRVYATDQNTMDMCMEIVVGKRTEQCMLPILGSESTFRMLDYNRKLVDAALNNSYHVALSQSSTSIDEEKQYYDDANQSNDENMESSLWTSAGIALLTCAAVAQRNGGLAAVIRRTGGLAAVTRRTGGLAAVARRTGGLAAVTRRTGGLAVVTRRTGWLAAVARLTGWLAA